ncbi:switch subunit [Thalictrum thalictroides]|uniref:Switch subunit n=1 Tax=Thalictrum thalictroides TaxID=46969 RepID=A0A7J6VWX7_THATH|nr:switch subunit [Thalictrum thalictroides]
MNTTVEAAVVEAQAHIQKEEQDLEKSIADIVEVQMKELEDKIVHFEELELQMEKEWKQLHYMKNLLFSDQLALLFQKPTPSALGDINTGAKTSNTVTLIARNAIDNVQLRSLSTNITHERQ